MSHTMIMPPRRRAMFRRVPPAPGLVSRTAMLFAALLIAL